MYGQPVMYPSPTYGYSPGYAPPPPPPVYYPPPPQPQQGPVIINLSGQNNMNNTGQGLGCPVCAHETGNIPRKTVGAVTIFWCLFLGLATGVLCCVPFCSDSCKDTELICVKCQTVKSKINANCC